MPISTLIQLFNESYYDKQKSMIQTVEEAAQELSESYPIERAYDIVEGFKAGAAWQKEQCIDWVRVENGLPKLGIGKSHLLLLVTDGKKIDTSLLQFDGKFTCTFIHPTHYALINLPKTDK